MTQRTNRPSWSILNPSKRYTNAANTNIAKTFARVRREQAQATELQRVTSIGTYRATKKAQP